jgi:16S rRNA (guanine(966)-N(2))-methyltransferase RsmD
MRIGGGEAKGIHIKSPKGIRTRPTADKLREAIFDMLGERVTGAKVLDLFAGSGALGIESLSRGAEFAVFVEKDRTAARIIEENLAKTGLSSKAQLIRADFRLAIKRLHREQRRFDLIFLDPPYQADLVGDMVFGLDSHLLVEPNAVIVYEHFKKTAPPASISGLPLAETRQYGQTSLSYFCGR